MFTQHALVILLRGTLMSPLSMVQLDWVTGLLIGKDFGQLSVWYQTSLLSCIHVKWVKKPKLQDKKKKNPILTW